MLLDTSIKHMRLRLKTLKGYINLLLTSDSIIMRDGKNLQTEYDELINKLSTSFLYGSNYIKIQSIKFAFCWGRAIIPPGNDTVYINFPITFKNTDYNFQATISQNGSIPAKWMEGTTGANTKRTQTSTSIFQIGTSANWNTYYNWIVFGFYE